MVSVSIISNLLNSGRKVSLYARRFVHLSAVRHGHSLFYPIADDVYNFTIEQKQACTTICDSQMW